MRLKRFVLIVYVLLTGYCAVMFAILFPWMWAVIAIGAVPVLRKKRSAALYAHGTARWANDRDVRPMLKGNGLILGIMHGTTGRIESFQNLFESSEPSDIVCHQFLKPYGTPLPELLRLNNAVHTAVFAPTGVGKGVSCVIPFLLTCEDSCVVVDFKGENAKITADARRKMGQRVVILDPWHLVTETPDTFNALDFIQRDDPNALDACRSLASAMVIRDQEKGDGVHFLDNAESAIAAEIALVVRSGTPGTRSLQMVCDLMSSPDNWSKSIEVMTQSQDWSGLLARMAGSLMHLKDRELASTMTTSNRFLRFMSTPAVAASTMSSTFDPSDLLRGKMTVYLVIPPEHMRAQAALLRLWIGSMLRAVVRGGLQEQNKVHFVLDEAASLGHMDTLDDALDKYRAYAVRLQFYYQSLGQLKLCWPDGRDQTLLSNVSQVFFGINDLDTAKLVSERLGKETIVVTGGGTGTSSQRSKQGGGQGGGSSSHSSGTSTNENWQQSARELLQPNEVMALDPRIAITFTPGVPPIWTKLVRYYEAGFRKKHGSRVKAFFGGAFFLLVLGVVAYALTLLVRAKL